MSGILLTQDDGAILGPISKLLGFIMEGIFNVLDAIGIPNIGLAIIIFTIVIYLLLMPLTIKQQKFSKLSAKMSPELQAIQKKYKNKKDNESMMAMNQETQAVYAKYGVSPTGSCVQLIIQMPILFALYRVIYAMPAYVTKIKDAFYPLVEKLRSDSAAVEYVKGLQNSAMYMKQFNNDSFVNGNVQYVENTMMPLMSAFFCFTLPAGMGLYWIAGAVVRSIQQVMINRHIDKMDINEVIKKNEAKAAKKIEKMKANYENVSNYAAMKTKSVNSKASYVNTADKEEALQKANDYYSKNAKPGSIAAKANMVKEYNEKNNR